MMDAFTEQAAELYQSGKSLAEVAAEMNTSKGWISRKLRTGGVPPKRATKNLWTAAECELFVANASLPDEALAALLPGRTICGVKNRRTVLGATKTNTTRKRWTDADYQFIQDHAALTDYAISKAMGLTGSSVKQARQRLGKFKVYTCKVCGSILAQQGAFCSEHTNVARQLRAYSSKAMVKGREFGLTEQETYKLLTSNCTYCGGPGYGIDRIDSSKGYIPGNVTPCCTTCNVMKNDLTVDQFEEHIRRIATHMKDTK